MPHNGYRSRLVGTQGDGNAVTNTNTPTSILPGGGVFSVPANFLEYVGMNFMLEVRGRISNAAAGPTLVLDFRMGGTVVAASQAMTLNASALTNQTFILRMLLTLRAIDSAAGGSTANFMFTGEFISRAVVGAGAAGSTGVSTLLIPETAPAVGSGFDMTATNTANVFATWSTANASCSIQSHQATLESLD